MAEHLVEAHPAWDKVPAIADTFSKVRRKRAIRRAKLAATLAILVALPLAILLRGEGFEPPFIGPTGPPTMLSPTPPARPVTSCTAKALPGLPDEPGPVFLGGEPTGRYLVGVNDRDAEKPRPVLWADGVPSTFAIPSGSLTGIAVNSAGVVAGSNYDEARSSFKVWTYYNGQLTIVMDSRKANEARPVLSINTRGDILLGNGPAGMPALRLAGRRPVLRELPAPEGATDVFPADLGEDGTVVGYTDDSESAVVWAPDQSARRLPTPGEGWRTMAWRIRGEWVVGGGEETASYFISDDGRVVGGGSRFVSDGREMAISWSCT